MTNHTIAILSALLEDIPIGTNLALLHFMWMLVSGALLPNRGAMFPALKSTGLSDVATRRAWVAFRKGVWQIAAILTLRREQVKTLPGWKERRYEGYLPITANVTAHWRPALQNCPSKHYHPAAGRALPAVIMGIRGEVGELNGQRTPCHAPLNGYTQKTPVKSGCGKTAKKELGEDEILVVDAGVKIAALQKAQVWQYVIRLATNFTARRNFLPEHILGRKPTQTQRYAAGCHFA